MVAVIKTGHSIHRIFNYNENKVKQDVAECIGAGNYPLDHDQMNLNMKLNLLLNQLALNENVTRNSVHISLNFHASEGNLPAEKLLEITDSYMNKIGFGKQPYLIYRHYDAGHPHIHIVSIKVRHDGSRIDMNNIGRNQSEEARKYIETQFKLVRAEDQKQLHPPLKAIQAAKVLYGKSQTKMAIQNVLEAVLNQYRYTSLPELNAVLKQYNVKAERGGEDSSTFKKNGLLYRVLDSDGTPVGIPIKASLFYSKPTLAQLQSKFTENESKRANYKNRVKNEVDKALLAKKTSIPDLVTALAKQGIHIALHKNEQDLVYGVTYVDHQTKCVFNGSALGKQYSAKAIQERCLQDVVTEQNLLAHSAQQAIGLQPQGQPAAAEARPGKNAINISLPTLEPGKLLEAILEPEQAPDYVPNQLTRKKKRKKRKNK
jgi:hypothetical protein